MTKEEMGSNFYMLTAQILDDKNLNHAEKLTMAILNGLARSDGSCYPSNEWLAEKLDIHERKVRAILENLEKNNYIKREIMSCASNSFKKYRIIFINTNFKLFLPEAENGRSGGAENGRLDRPKTAGIIDKKIEYMKAEERERAAPPPPAPPVSDFAFKRVSMKEEEYKKLVEEYGEARIMEKIEALDEYADINPKKFKQYGKHSSVIRSWIKKDLIKNKFEASKSDPDLNSSQKENLKLNDELVNELKLDYPDRCSTMSIYYKNHLLKSKDPYFDISMLVDHKEFCRFLEKHLKIRILEVRFPNG